MRYSDRSRTTTDWTCRRRRYLNYEMDGVGYAPESEAVELFLGATVHDCLAAIAFQHQAGSVDIGTIAKTAYTSVYQTFIGEGEEKAQIYAQEQATLIEGLIRGFYRHVWPQLIGQYPQIIAVEQELTYPVTSELMFMAKPDLVLGNEQGEVFYIEYKTTGSKSEEWVKSWSTAVQLHSTLKAIEHTLGVTPDGVIVQGLYKGYVNYGKQTSPFCYAYSKKAYPPFHAGEVYYEYAAGTKRVPVWQLPGGLERWVDNMPLEVISDQFPRTPPIFVKEDLVNQFFRQLAVREKDIAEFQNPDPMDLDEFFPQNFSACQPPSRMHACPYIPICHGSGQTHPLQMHFTRRTPHHKPEADALGTELA